MTTRARTPLPTATLPTATLPTETLPTETRPSATPLPELGGLGRPRWRPDVPALWRDAATIQLGDEVIVDRVTRAHLAWLSSLDGLRTTADVESTLPLDRAEARRLLRALLAAGGLDDAARIPDAVRWAPQEEREVVARRFGAALHATGDLDAAYRAMAARDAVRAHVVGDGDLAREVTLALTAAGLRLSPDPGPATIVVLTDAHHPHVPAHIEHDLPDLPHLHVAARASTAVVGPLVDPGRTSCLRCAHLHRRDADPAWPLLAVQWAQAVPAHVTVDPLLARHAATHAVTLLRTWADAPDDPAAWSDRALTITGAAGDSAWVTRPPHPLCGCRWPSA